MNESKEIFDAHNSNKTSKTLKYQTLNELNKMKNNTSSHANMASMASSLQQNTAEAQNSICQNVKQQSNQQQQQQLQYLTSSAIDNCFANDGTSTIVNIDIFDDQLSTSSNSNTSRFSCETAPLSTTTPPMSLNGVINTNLMHFSPNAIVPQNTERLHCGCHRLSVDVTTSEHKCDSTAAAADNHNCDDDNSSNGSAGSL